MLLALLGHFGVLRLRGCARLQLGGAAVQGSLVLVFLCLIVVAILANRIGGTRHNFRLGALDIMMSRNEHRSLQVAELMGRFAEEALELHLGLIASKNFLVVVRICDGDNFLVRGL